MSPERVHCKGLRSQRGAALVATFILCLAVLLIGLFTHRNLIFEQRTSANQYRAAQAFEAAEAGQQWTLAQLNGWGTLGDDCLPTGSGTSFRQRFLELNADGYRAKSGVSPAALMEAVCHRTAARWACHCPADTEGVPATASADSTPSFRVTITPSPEPNVIELNSFGCINADDECEADGTADAITVVRSSLAFISGLSRPPTAALTVRGEIDTDAALEARNTDPSTGGLAVHAGGPLRAPNARYTGVPGAPSKLSVRSDDNMLQTLSRDQLFASYFGMDKRTYAQMPSVMRMQCAAPCADKLLAAYESGARLLWIDGTLRLPSGTVLGSVSDPIVLVVDGAAEIDGAASLHGMLYAQSIEWNGAGGHVLGAVVVEADLRWVGSPHVGHHRGVLAALSLAQGTFVPVPGSWRDF